MPGNAQTQESPTWQYVGPLEREEDRADWQDGNGWWARVSRPECPRPHSDSWNHEVRICSILPDHVRAEWTSSRGVSWVGQQEATQIAAGLREPLFTCPHCEGAFAMSEGTQVEHGHRPQTVTICTDCRNEQYVFLSREQIWADRWEVMNLRDTGEAVTAGYAEENCYQCEATGDWYMSAEAASDAEREYYRQESDRPTFDYHSATPMSVHGWPGATPKNSLCFGVELEMESADSDSYGQDDVSAALGGRTGDGPRESNEGINGTFILMNDGSLNDTGVELITNPYTLEFHQSQFGWKELLSNVTSIARSGRGTSACGMHVHCNRKAISALTLGKALVFVNSNENAALIERIAQRNGEQWARRSPKKIVDGKVQRTNKYEAMHIADKTIEFRIFRGNLRWDRVLKNIEFCHSVFTYAATASMEAVSTKKDYLQWLNKNRGMYPNLVRFLGETYGFRDTAKNKTRATEL